VGYIYASRCLWYLFSLNEPTPTNLIHRNAGDKIQKKKITSAIDVYIDEKGSVTVK
jgi:transcriptional regulator